MNKKSCTQWVIYYACVIHIIWGILLLIDSTPFYTNPIGFFDLFLNQTQTAVIFLMSAIVALVSPKIKHILYRFICLLPQQILLLLTAFSGIVSSLTGQYIDGTVRSGLFIFADQLPIMLLGLFYGLAIYERIAINNH